MSEQGSDEAAGHGVSGTRRGDSGMEEEPVESAGQDTEEWAEKTETGGEAAS